MEAFPRGHTIAHNFFGLKEYIRANASHALLYKPLLIQNNHCSHILCKHHFSKKLVYFFLKVIIVNKTQVSQDLGPTYVDCGHGQNKRQESLCYSSTINAKWVGELVEAWEIGLKEVLKICQCSFSFKLQ